MRNGEPGWFASLLGAAVLIAGGFALGLVAGVVSEEPELVVGHLAGRSEEVAWLPEGEGEFTPAEGEARAVAPEERAYGIDEVTPLEEVLAQEGRRPVERAAVEGEAQDWTDDAPVEETELPAVAAAPPRQASPFRDIGSLPETGRSAPPPAAPAPSVRSRAEEVPLSGFAVQVGAFSDALAAAEVREKLLGHGFDSYVIPASRAGDGKWRVRVGPVPTREAADSLAGRLKSEERLPTWVLSEGGG